MAYQEQNRILVVIFAIASALIIVVATDWILENNTHSPTPIALSENGSAKAPENSAERSTELLTEQVPDTDSIDLAFGNGEWVQVSWRGRDWGGPALPPFGHQYTALHEKASSGDRYAAYTLFHMLRRCKVGFDSVEEMDAALETALTKREYRVLGLDQPIQITSDEMLDRVMSELAGNYSGCQPITSAQTAEAGKWLKEAADGGPTDAMNGYGSLLDDHKLALDYIERAWSLGSMSSLNILHYMKKHPVGIAMLRTLSFTCSDAARSVSTAWKKWTLRSKLH